jgi:hypothetical protein
VWTPKGRLTLTLDTVDLDTTAGCVAAARTSRRSSGPARTSRTSRRVVDWFDSVPASRVFLNVMVIGELRQGVERLSRRDPARAEAIGQWLGRLLTTYGDRVAPVTTEVAET